MVQATIRFEGATAPEANGHGLLTLSATDTGCELPIASPELLATADVREAVLRRAQELSPSALVLAGERDGTRFEIVLSAPLAAGDIEAALAQLHAALTPIAWVPPPQGMPPNYHDLVWAAAAGRVGELVNLRKDYEEHVGKILDAYWPHQAKVGAAAVEHKRWGPRRNEVKLEQITGDLRAGDWTEVLQMLDHEASRAHNALRGNSQRTAVERLCSVAAQIYPHFDVRSYATQPVQAEPEEVKARKKDLGSVKRYINEAAKREAPIVYATGVAIGIPLALVVASLIAVVLWGFDVTAIDEGLLFGCIVMGALGAVLSVLQRLGRQVAPRLDIEVAREYVRLLGAVRPLVGAVFGLVLYFALASGLLFQKVVDGDLPRAHLAVYLILAFIAGFNERWATGALGSIAGGNQSARDDDVEEDAEPAPKPDGAARPKP